MLAKAVPKVELQAQHNHGGPLLPDTIQAGAFEQVRRRPKAKPSRQAEEEQPERVMYVQRPAEHKLPRRPGSVPNFRALHSAWSRRLAAAKAAVHQRLTVPQVLALIYL